jgi:hypothetical protein
MAGRYSRLSRRCNSGRFASFLIYHLSIFSKKERKNETKVGLNLETKGVDVGGDFERNKNKIYYTCDEKQCGFFERCIPTLENEKKHGQNKMRN